MIQVELLKVVTDECSIDKEIAEAAWASTNQKSSTLIGKTSEDVEKVVTMLINDSHDTPKEVVWFKFFLAIPIFCERQLDKYRMTIQRQDIQLEFLQGGMGRDFITQNEYSGRYRTLINEFIGMPEDVINIWDKGNDDVMNIDIHEEWNNILTSQYNVYKSWLSTMWKGYTNGYITNAEYKRFREFVRGMLGTAYMTHMQWFMNLNALEHILCQRLKEDTQIETQWIAQLMLEEILKLENPPKAVQEMVKKYGWQALN